MCGIAGIFSYQSTAPSPSQSELDAYCLSMAKRGPDGEGKWRSEDKRVLLGHRRLSIIDLSDASAQPMVGQGGLCITYNGEIYNYEELRDELKRKGYTFRTSGDTEVLLALYREYGQGMVHHLRGMFALAIYDPDDKTLFCARDPFGIKPYYYNDNGNTIRFASSVKALLAGGQIDTTLDEAGLVGFLMLGSVPEPRTIYRSIKALGAGQMMVVAQDARPKITTWYSLAQNLSQGMHGLTTCQSNQDDIANALRDSVNSHMVADTPVGLFLSAGIDSTAILGLLKDNGFKNTQAITAGFSEFKGQAQDEVGLAAQTAKFYGADHTTRMVGQAEFQDDLDGFVAAMDQPTIDGLNTWYVAKAAKEAGLKVCLSGLGADELFGGYPSFNDVPRWARRWSHLGPKEMRIKMVSALSRFVDATPIHIHPKALALAGLVDGIASAWHVRRGLFMPWELADILGPEIAAKGLKELALDQVIKDTISPDPGTDMGRIMLMEMSLYMRNQLLRDSDWASMAHSIEIRVPFVDHKLFEALAPALAAGNTPGKSVLTRIQKSGFPQNLINRPKTGFTLPIDDWTKDYSNQLTKQYGENRVRGHWSRRWALTVLQKTDGFYNHAKPELS